MWYDQSATVGTLQSFIAPAGGVVAAFAAVALAILGFRYFFSDGDTGERLHRFLAGAGAVMGFAVLCGLLAGGGLADKLLRYFTEGAGGMGGIEQSAEADVDNPFRPDDGAWDAITVDQIETVPPNVPGRQDPETVYGRVDAAAKGANAGADWAAVFVALHEAGYWSEEEVRADEEMASRLAELGIADLSDPILYDNSPGSTRFTLDYWKQVMERMKG